MNNLLTLALAWAAWAALHSLLVGHHARRAAARFWPALGRHWRFGYALIAALSLIPVLLLYRSALGGPEVLTWPNRWLPGLIWLAALAMFISAGRVFGLMDFLGLGSLLNSDRTERPRPDKPLTRGILGWIRHPFYASGLLLLWARNLDRAGLVTSVVLSAYLLIGTWIEEKRLEKEWGPAWLEYRRNVSAFFPWKRLKSLLGGLK